MYLKALEIQGFKSFPDKTRMTFEKNITAIVGPNGSGKSNISDAVLWVMGEQRTKALRGSKMEDVIFGGTEKRNSLGFAQVSLIIDNTARIFDSDRSEVELTRRYYRSGESEYFINREQVRLKDINSLLMDTGLGRDGYSIIGQGRISEIVSSKSGDRREVFEEAAGISRYRYRKEEAENKLQKTEENLLRINDKIEELEIQVGPLKQQAETAKKYLVLRDGLRLQEVSLWMATLDKLHDQAGGVLEEYRQVTQSLDSAREGLDALYVSTDSLTERMHRLDEDRERQRDLLTSAEQRASECDASIAVLNASIVSSEETKARLIDDISRQESRAAEIAEKISAGDARKAGISSALKELAEKMTANANVLEGCRMKLSTRENILSSINSEANSLSVEIGSSESRIKILGDMEKEYEGYSKAVKTVMRESGRGNLKGIRGPVANLVRTDEACALAIETALGAAAQNIVTDTQNDGRLAIELLKRLDSGRATFLPLDTISGTVMKDAPEDDIGFIGIAYNLVRFDRAYEQIFANLLGRTVVVESLTDAVRISKKSGNRLRIVTLDGQMINAGGSMTGGSAISKSGFLSRANELEKLRFGLEELKLREKECADRLARAKTELSAVRYQLDMAMEDKAALQSEESSLKAEATAVASANEQLAHLLESITGDAETRRAAVEKCDSDIAETRRSILDREAVLQTIKKEAESIRAEIESIGARKLELEGKRTKAEKDSQERSRDIIELERRKARIEQKKNSAEMEEKQLLDKLWDNYELSHSEAEKIRTPVESFSGVNKKIAEYKREISALGTPNIGAIDEFERVNSRYVFLTGQRDDIEKARRELAGIINDVTNEMKTVFVTKFREIDACFKETFSELFGGGKAELVLEDENNVLECGIEIKVQPPGKAVSTISLLSGGETAFVAIALYFAILKVRPTPFCIMDEIDAALDDANVGRFADYMQRISNKTQFLVITHRRGTMESADMLYGVTMQEKGVSTVLELDLDEARKTVEE